MNNCTDVVHPSERFDPASDITIEIVRADECPDGNLPSTFFPGAGSDGALFQVVNHSGPFPSEGDMCLALSRKDSDNCLSRYDEKTGRGYYRILDSYAPAQGTVMTLPGLVQAGEDDYVDDWEDWDRDDWDSWHRTSGRCMPLQLGFADEAPVSTPIDPEQERNDRIDHLCCIARDEIDQMTKRALQRLEEITM